MVGFGLGSGRTGAPGAPPCDGAGRPGRRSDGACASRAGRSRCRACGAPVRPLGLGRGRAGGAAVGRRLPRAGAGRPRRAVGGGCGGPATGRRGRCDVAGAVAGAPGRGRRRWRSAGGAAVAGRRRAVAARAAARGGGGRRRGFGRLRRRGGCSSEWRASPGMRGWSGRGDGLATGAAAGVPADSWLLIARGSAPPSPGRARRRCWTSPRSPTPGFGRAVPDS